MESNDFDRFASAFGDGSLVVGFTINTGGKVLRIPDFMVEEGEVIRLSKVEAEAELILRSKKSQETYSAMSCLRGIIGLQLKRIGEWLWS